MSWSNPSTSANGMLHVGFTCKVEKTVTPVAIQETAARKEHTCQHNQRLWARVAAICDSECPSGCILFTFLYRPNSLRRITEMMYKCILHTSLTFQKNSVVWVVVLFAKRCWHLQSPALRSGAALISVAWPAVQRGCEVLIQLVGTKKNVWSLHPLMASPPWKNSALHAH